MVHANLNYTLEDFTYFSAVKGLWLGHNHPIHEEWHDGGPGPTGKLAAVILILFSGVWPHVKLAVMNWAFHARRVTEETRSAWLYVLDTFGKWSLADIMVVCCLLCLMDVNVPMTGETILQYVDEAVADWRNSIDPSDPNLVRDSARFVCSYLLDLKHDDVCANACCALDNKCHPKEEQPESLFSLPPVSFSSQATTRGTDTRPLDRQARRRVQRLHVRGAGSLPNGGGSPLRCGKALGWDHCGGHRARRTAGVGLARHLRILRGRHHVPFAEPMDQRTRPPRARCAAPRAHGLVAPPAWAILERPPANAHSFSRSHSTLGQHRNAARALPR